MDTEGIVIRNAMQEDAPFIAKCVVEAMGMPCFNPENMQEDTTVLLEVMEELCRMEESLYSWKHADMAIDAATGEPAGCLISYDGGLYAGLRQKTLSYARQRIGKEMPESGMETQAGEFYLDSMAILPEYRGFRIGQRLMLNAVRKGREAGIDKTSLIVDKEAPGLQAYYASAGFVPDGEMIFFGHPYVRMVSQK